MAEETACLTYEEFRDLEMNLGDDTFSCRDGNEEGVRVKCKMTH